MKVAWLILLLSTGMEVAGVTLLKMNVLGWGFILFFLAPVIYLIALSRLEVSVAYPVKTGVTLLMLFIVAFTVLGETITGPKLAGCALVLVGAPFLYHAA